MSDHPHNGDEAGKPTPKVPNWRRLDWWLGNSPEQIEAVNLEAKALQQTPLWFRVGLVIFGVLAAAVLIALKGWFIVIPTVGMLLIFGVHYLITGKVMKPPIPLWFHLAFWALLIVTLIVARSSR